jgi:flagellar basal body-associated protein FliL
MANEPKHQDASDADEPKIEESAAGKSIFSKFFGHMPRYWLGILLVATLVIHGAGLAYYKLWITRNQAEISPEIGLGNFEFSADRTSGSRIAGAEFSLYITTLDGLDRLARNRLASHKFRVQGEIESLLRKAHSGDFEDPSLNDLKRRIRDQINETLDSRVVSDVVITKLKITPADNKAQKEAVSDAAEPSPTPWVDKSTTYVSQQGEN